MIATELRRFWSAVQFLTRLPTPLPHDKPPPPLSEAAPHFPLAGLIVGGAAALVLLAASQLGLPALPAAALAIGVQILLTGGLHEDGLADTADGLGGGATKERALEIMGDSRIGSYGALALGLTLILRVTALAALPPEAAALALLVAAALSRSAMAALMTALPPAKTGGLSAAAGRAGLPRSAIAVAFAAGLCLALGAAPALLTALVAWLWLRWRFQARLGGVTGDSFGATQQIVEVAALLALAATWA